MSTKISNIAKNTEEITKLLEEQLGQMTNEEQEMFHLSPRDTDNHEVFRQAKFNTTYDITPSKTNRYKSIRESAQASKRDTNLHSSLRLGGQSMANNGNEE